MCLCLNYSILKQDQWKHVKLEYINMNIYQIASFWVQNV